MKTYYVHILASKRNGMLYIGVTNDLIRLVKCRRVTPPDGLMALLIRLPDDLMRRRVR